MKSNPYPEPVFLSIMINKNIVRVIFPGKNQSPNLDSQRATKRPHTIERGSAIVIHEDTAVPAISTKGHRQVF